MTTTKRRWRIVMQVLCIGACAAVRVPRAEAFCRGLTESPPPGFDQTVSCFEGTNPAEVKKLYWLNACVGYSLQKDASRQITLDEATKAAAQAFAVWNAVDCGGGQHPSINSANDLGPVACNKVEYNAGQPNQHVILFRDDGWPYAGATNTLGLTTLRFDKATGEIFDADVEINASDVMLKTAESMQDGAVNVQSVMLHEIGHYLGLAHSTDANAVMYAYYKPVSLTLTQDDVDGICAIYPPDGTRVTSAGPLTAAACDPLPRHGFSSQCATPGADAAETSDAPKTSGCSLARAAHLSSSRERAVRPLGWMASVPLFAWAVIARRARKTARTTRRAWPPSFQRRVAKAH